MTASFRNLFRHHGVSRIEIPMIQRDYAQGREDPGVTRIRRAFLQVLDEALAGGVPVGLDFVYGEIDGGRLVPLDGQQRLTTLFLLHWYLAARCRVADQDSGFLGMFTYRTRFSARHFCERLIRQRPPFPQAAEGGDGWRLSAWLTDQHWYAGAWKYDPTIQSMLVTLDDIHGLFARRGEQECCAAWERLVAEDGPPITFDFLSIKNLGLSDELYIKMNSRGKPLTPFEHFKAVFEKTLGESSSAARAKFVSRVDQAWSDLLWPLRNSGAGGSDDMIIDDEFLRLFHFIGDVVACQQGLDVDGALFDADIDQWAERIYGTQNPDAQAAQRYMFEVLDSLADGFSARGIRDRRGFVEWFGELFTDDGHAPGRVAIFGDINLFGECCARYGAVSGKKRAFPLARTLLLFAFLAQLMRKPHLPHPVVAARMRVMRNLIFASNNEIRPDNFKALLDETARYIETGELDQLNAFNKSQIAEERNKQALMQEHAGIPGLQACVHRLEDHPLLRGCLAAFDLGDADRFMRHAALFEEIFPPQGNAPVREISAALLACGDYWQRTRNDRFQFGSPRQSQQEIWRLLLTNANIAGTRAALGRMLDAFDGAEGESVAARLAVVADAYLDKQEAARMFDWRYYLVKYPAMRSGASGLYASSSGRMGFDLCMLKATTLASYYHDPYLHAAILESRTGSHYAEDEHYGSSGYRPEGRWIKLNATGEQVMRCHPDGFQLKAPGDAGALAHFEAICAKHGIGPDLVLRVRDDGADEREFDHTDRVRAAASLLRELAA